MLLNTLWEFSGKFIFGLQLIFLVLKFKTLISRAMVGKDVKLFKRRGFTVALLKW